jgi:hypothetical protein
VHKCKLRVGHLILLCILSAGTHVSAQSAATTNPAPHKFTGKLLELRIRRQRDNVQQGLTNGTLSKTQAGSINSNLDALAAEIDMDRKKNGGVLNPNEVKSLDNRLTESRNILQAAAGSNKRIDDGPNTLGAKWVPGPDGGENPKALTAEMRKEEKRELRQARQNFSETLERQQIEYERAAMQSLNDNRSGIINEKTGLENVRKDGGN